MSGQRPYLVQSRVIGVVMDLVYASTPDEAIALVRSGRGDQVNVTFDTSLEPVSMSAELDELIDADPAPVGL
ncbi:hypothetical protein [Leucobacter celer]|uniref:hypothetical protein n=1 Tax=Leucobacter celer TaxID=668625 RepID=UPI0006A7AE99|nr:hypothetical protein [Leucobacter celer]